MYTSAWSVVLPGGIYWSPHCRSTSIGEFELPRESVAKPCPGAHGLSPRVFDLYTKSCSGPVRLDRYTEPAESVPTVVSPLDVKGSPGGATQVLPPSVERKKVLLLDG